VSVLYFTVLYCTSTYNYYYEDHGTVSELQWMPCALLLQLLYLGVLEDVLPVLEGLKGDEHRTSSLDLRTYITISLATVKSDVLNSICLVAKDTNEKAI
jgi:hypothetical protein